MMNDLKANLAKKMLDAGEGSLVEVSGAELALILSGQMNEVLAKGVAAARAATPEPDHKAHLHKQDQAAVRDRMAEKSAQMDAQATVAPQVSFEEVVKPLMKWMAENQCPHSHVVVDATGAELFHGQMRFNSFEFVKD